MWVFHYKHMGTMCKMSNYIHKIFLNTRGTASIVFLVKTMFAIVSMRRITTVEIS